MLFFALLFFNVEHDDSTNKNRRFGEFCVCRIQQRWLPGAWPEVYGILRFAVQGLPHFISFSWFATFVILVFKVLSSFNPSLDPFGWCCDLCWKFKTLMRNILTLVLGTYSRSLAVEPLVYPNLDWGWEIHFGFARLSPDCFPIFWVQCRFWLVTVKIMICFRIIWYENSVHP